MARIRTIKPELVSDERTAGLSDGAFRLFVAMITMADDHGNVRASVPWLTGQVWWARGDSPRVAEVLREVADAGLIAIYSVRNQSYAHLNGWTKHQRIDNAGKPQVPTPAEADTEQLPKVAAVRGEAPRIAAGLGSLREEGERDWEATAKAPSLDLAKQIRTRCWAHMVARFAAVQADGIDKSATAPHGIAAGTPERDLGRRIGELVASGGYEFAEAEVMRRIDAAEHEARQKRTLRWFKATDLFDEVKFWKGLDRDDRPAPVSTAAPSVKPVYTRNGKRWRDAVNPDDNPICLGTVDEIDRDGNRIASAEGLAS